MKITEKHIKSKYLSAIEISEYFVYQNCLYRKMSTTQVLNIPNNGLDSLEEVRVIPVDILEIIYEAVRYDT